MSARGKQFLPMGGRAVDSRRLRVLGRFRTSPSGSVSAGLCVQLTRQLGDRGVDQCRPMLFIELGGDHPACRGNRDIDSDGADFGNRPRLLLCDPFLRKPLPALHTLFHRASRFRRDPLSLGFGVGDDLLSFGGRLAFAGAKLREGALGFLLVSRSPQRALGGCARRGRRDRRSKTASPAATGSRQRSIPRS